MKIAILGAGAMGTLFGGYLSRRNEVYLVDVNASRIEEIVRNGVRVREKAGKENVFWPSAVTDTAALPEMDLIIIFVKSVYTAGALEANRGIIGKNTYLMTLQNGTGHELKISAFADMSHIIIGTTQHNSSIIADGYVHHGGDGKTMIGLANGKSEDIRDIASSFTACGIDCEICNDIKAQIWRKLFTNTAASSLTAVLQVPLGFIYDDVNARVLMRELCKEAVMVANAEGFVNFDEHEIVNEVENVCKNAPKGYTSIYADVKAGTRSEVDTISGSVVEGARELGISVPHHEMIVHLIHALEHKNQR